MQVKLELLGETSVYIALGVQVVTAIILGGIIGFDRERKFKPAGIKTNILICLGATLYTAMAHLNIQELVGGNGIDPNRLPAYIISGIGFLGAGTIIQAKGEVTGLTSAATIWVVASLGVFIGSGYPVLAGMCTITVLIVLRLINPLYDLLTSRKDYIITLKSRDSIKAGVNFILSREACIFYGMEESEENGLFTNFAFVTSEPNGMSGLCKKLRRLSGATEVTYEIAKD